MTKTETKKFSRRFSFEDWSALCSNVAFLEALENEGPFQCEAIAHELLTKLRDGQSVS